MQTVGLAKRLLQQDTDYWLHINMETGHIKVQKIDKVPLVIKVNINLHRPSKKHRQKNEKR